MGWASITRTDVAGDLLALIRHLGGPAIIVGHSISGGAATIAAANASPSWSAASSRSTRSPGRKGSTWAACCGSGATAGALALLTGTQLLRSLGLWMRYLDLAYPAKPADYAGYMAALAAKLREPGRMAEFMKTGKSTPADAGAQLPNIRCPALVIMGTLDPDFADPQAEGDAIVAAMPTGLGTVAMVDGAGHYPHAQSPDEVAALRDSLPQGARRCLERG